ncbi:hypothetical protein I4U23_006686 [Adineta vaga]|nr:hypothetical protein I4U23_006686 [Adineta vaga]
MSSRRGRLNWSNMQVHISDDAIDKQHRFTAVNSLSSTSVSIDNSTEYEQAITSLSPSVTTKPSWKPKAGVGDIRAEEFVGNFMLTNAEQTAIDRKYNKQTKHLVENSNVSPVPKPIRISNRLSSIRDTPLSIRMTNLVVGQHLLNVFVCHVESYSSIYIMFGDDYHRATKLFQEMNSCEELIQPLNINFEPKENDLVALNHETKWFRGRCLNSTSTNIDVFCIDSGATIICSKNNIRRLPDSSLSDAVHTECFELLYKDRYEAIVTRVDSSDRPTIVLYYDNENVNDQLLKLLKLL